MYQPDEQTTQALIRRLTHWAIRRYAPFIPPDVLEETANFALALALRTHDPSYPSHVCHLGNLFKRAKWRFVGALRSDHLVTRDGALATRPRNETDITNTLNNSKHNNSPLDVTTQHQHQHQPHTVLESDFLPQHLSRQSKLLLVLRYDHGLSQQDIAHIVNLTAAGVSRRLKDLHDQIREHIKPYRRFTPLKEKLGTV